MTKEIFIIRKTETRTVTTEVQVKATSLAAAEKKVREIAAPSDAGVTNVTLAVVARWPAAEGEEVTHHLGGGFHARRGWFYTALLNSYRGQRKVSFTSEQVLDETGRPNDTKIKAFLGSGERCITFTKSYGWCARHDSTPMWSRVFDEPKAALRSTRRFLEEQKRRIHDRQRYEREEIAREQRESIDNAALIKMLEAEHVLERLGGGKWAPEYEDDEALKWFALKETIDRLLAQGFIRVKAVMNLTKQPRVVELTDAGILRAAALRRLPEVLR